ncbi:hypothetical protein EDF56_10363 [Novosphingobium sp. PhB165]|uniref:hypothetical protein n=1 Tax=Novosphingobium sp. PhB165 TaxID=2485105 RepID=UPI0010532498|nr:hypothetical protein [Novosphingobium sp. PhB165]TCM19428.1 hypothetical protein EDF56_10363 [Novosphingobium sp. PhB165]
MTHRTLDLRIDTGGSDGAPATIAVTVHLPEQDRLSSSPPLLLCLPGGGYNRRYFDLAEAGYSEAAHHVARG